MMEHQQYTGRNSSRDMTFLVSGQGDKTVRIFPLQ